ncbi:fumarylacetoacetate hydrolase family protein [Streptomyces sp. NPDC087856]|uniref:fumarylacetoacetate hydrolase family protein n=1 Tax=Streptomyces sp. NPDC087856 TaxID=3365811 RepID=UPI00382C8279
MAKLVSFSDKTGRNGAGWLTDDDQNIDVIAYDQPVGTSAMRRLLETGPDQVTPVGETLSVDDVSLLPPVPDPSKIVAAPVNYRDHQSEMSQDAHISSLGVFLKAPSSLLAPGGTVRLPYTDRRFDQEGELAVVIGRACSNVGADEAADYVAGYTCLLDMTMRGGEDRSVRKSFDTFTPVGPAIVLPEKTGDLDTLRLRTWVNGSLRQDADLRDLIWGVPALIAYVSSVMKLLPGDIIATGTPAGVGAVEDGDEIKVSISGLGTLSVTVSREGAVACPTLGAGRGPTPPAIVTPVRQRTTNG